MRASGGPLSRPTVVTRLPPGGLEVDVLASAEERAALAADFGLPAIEALAGRFRVAARHGGVVVRGRVTARVTQTCVVSLEPFADDVDEEVDVSFEEAGDRRHDVPELTLEIDEDAPDEIVDGRIDFGVLTAEFFALGLDPYPKKPGVVFEAEAEGSADLPFAKLAALRFADPPDE